MASVVINGDTSGAVTISAPAVAGTPTLTLPTTTGTILTTASTAVVTQAMLSTNVVGNGPTFSYYQSSAQTLPTTTFTKLTFTSSDWDTTGGMFASSRFTPTVAGYYLISGGFETNDSQTTQITRVYKNGSETKAFMNTNPNAVTSQYGSATVYCNGSSDYVEIYGWVGAGQSLRTGSAYTYFQGTLIRSA